MENSAIRRRSARVWIAATLLLAAFAGSAPGAAQAQLNVVATTAMLADTARAVGGERVAVAHLMGEGVDPHTYRQTRNDVVRLGSADLVLYNGLTLEAQLEELLGELARRKPVVAVAERLDEARLLQSAAYPGRFDPHVWMDPSLWGDVTDIVRDVLSEVDPDGAGVYAANADAHRAALEELDGYAREALAGVPQSSRALITAHDAFAYFGRAYDFEVIGIQGISTESEAGLAQIERLVALTVERGIEAVFVESSVSERNVRALVEGARARGHRLEIGGQLFSDAMGPPGAYEGTYVGMIDHNVTSIARALGGEPPPLGMQGRLASES